MSLGSIANTRALSRLITIAMCSALTIGLGTARAAESGHHATRSFCPTCYSAEARAVPLAVPREDPLDSTLCRSAMSSSPPLVPLCGRYR